MNQKNDLDEKISVIEEDIETSKRKRSPYDNKRNPVLSYGSFVTWLDKNKVSFIWTVATFLATIILITFIVVTINIVNANNIEMKKMSLENVNLSNQVNEYNNKILAENEKYSEKMLNRLLPEDRLRSVTKNNWEYRLTVNGKSFEKTNAIYINTADVTIMLSEICTNTKIPEIINIKGSVTGGATNRNFYDNDMINISVSMENAKYDRTTSENKESNTKTAFFKYTNLKVGSIIDIQLNADLATRMGMDDNIVEVFYNTTK